MFLSNYSSISNQIIHGHILIICVQCFLSLAGLCPNRILCTPLECCCARILTFRSLCCCSRRYRAVNFIISRCPTAMTVLSLFISTFASSKSPLVKWADHVLAAGHGVRVTTFAWKTIALDFSFALTFYQQQNAGSRKSLRTNGHCLTDHCYKPL